MNSRCRWARNVAKSCSQSWFCSPEVSVMLSGSFARERLGFAVMLAVSQLQQSVCSQGKIIAFSKWTTTPTKNVVKEA